MLDVEMLVFLSDLFSVICCHIFGGLKFNDVIIGVF